jgi:hypothetical protein
MDNTETKKWNLRIEAAIAAREHESVKSKLAAARDTGAINDPVTRLIINQLEQDEEECAAIRYELAVRISDFL